MTINKTFSNTFNLYVLYSWFDYKHRHHPSARLLLPDCHRTVSCLLIFNIALEYLMLINLNDDCEL